MSEKPTKKNPVGSVLYRTFELYLNKSLKSDQLLLQKEYI